MIAACMVAYGTIDSLIDFFSFTAWIFYGGAMLALIVMRYTKPNYPRPYKVCAKKYEIKFEGLINFLYYVLGANYHSICGFNCLNIFSDWTDY